ncbi:MAG: TraB/GumN family protein [Candidatus Hadarchaeales archaeon]
MIRRAGENLTLIGVGHVLPKSLEDVRETILNEKPDVVAVELCPERYVALKMSARDRRGPGRNFLGWIMYLAQMRFSMQTGVLPGEEMLAAINAAEKAGSRVELIDVPIGITLKRLNERVGLKDRLRLLLHVLLSILPTARVDLTRLTEEEVVVKLLEELRGFSREIYEVLVEERDRHMALKLAGLLSGGKKVVAVVGAAHVPGVEKILKNIDGRWSVRLEYSTL